MCAKSPILTLKLGDDETLPLVRLLIACGVMANAIVQVDVERSTISKTQHKLKKSLYIGALLFGTAKLIARSSWCGYPTTISTQSLAESFTALETATSRTRLQATKTQFEQCSTVTASTTRHFSYNLTDEVATKQQWHFIDSSSCELNQKFQGKVTVNRGDLMQTSDIEVRIVLNASNRTNLEHVVFQSSNSTLELEYVAADHESDTCTDI
jgi:hypothetical protein